MKCMMVIVMFLAITAASWAAGALLDSQMRIFAGIETCNAWTTAALSVEAVSLLAASAGAFTLFFNGSNTLLYVSLGAFGAGLLTQMASLTFTAIGYVELNDSITRNETDAPRPLLPLTLSLVSVSSLPLAFILGSVLPADPYGKTFAILLFATSYVTGVCAVLSTNTYAKEIRWQEYERAQRTSAVISNGALTNSGHGTSGSVGTELRIHIPILSIAY
jgi:hypothetical protein